MYCDIGHFKTSRWDMIWSYGCSNINNNNFKTFLILIIIIIVIIKTRQNNVSGGRDECNEIRNFPGLFNPVASTRKIDRGCSFQTYTTSISKQESVCGVFICAWSICKCLCWILTSLPCPHWQPLQSASPSLMAYYVAKLIILTYSNSSRTGAIKIKR